MNASNSFTPVLYPPLPDAPADQRARKLRVCIVSPDFVGPIRNGGIGTAYTSMADALAADGHDVTCLYANGTQCAEHDIKHWIRVYAERGVKLVPLPRMQATLNTSEQATRSYEAYQWLKQQKEFDCIHFPEWQGLGYYPGLAKKQGLAFARTVLCVGIHSMTAWLKEGASEHLFALWELQADFQERESVALADVVVSPSQYLINWIGERGWKLPAASHVQPYIMPRPARRKDAAAAGTLMPVEELVFFGRLETRKGIRLFCDALDRLTPEAGARLKRVTFLGKDSVVDSGKGTAFIAKRAERWPWPVQLLTDRNQPQAVEYLRGPGRLAVIPSLLENSPLTVYECFGSGIAFLANRVGGIPELVAPEDVDRVCFANRPEALAEKLGLALADGFRLARPAISVADNERAWLDWHKSGAALYPAAAPLPMAWPKVSLCLTTFNRPSLLQQALASVRAIDYPALEVILVDDGSTRPDALAALDGLAPDFERRGWQIVRQENRYLGAARNTAARHATGEWLLFMDDDNVAESHEVRTLVRAAQHCGADILTCGMYKFPGEAAPQRSKPVEAMWLPLGPAVTVGPFGNCFGDANALVRRTCFEAVGGFTEDYGITHEDWEFHARAVLQGFKLQVVPEFLFWYRVNAGSMLRTLAPYPNYRRSLRPYEAAVPPELRNLVRFALGTYLHINLLAQELANQPAYTEMTVKWRAKLEAGLVLLELGQEAAAARTMIAGIKAVEASKNPRVILEALLGIAPHLGKLDPSRARFLLQLAAKSAEAAGRSDEVQLARQHLAELPSTPAAASPAPAKLTAMSA